MVWSAEYNSFGKATIGIGTIENNLRFAGQYEDAETGLYYNRYRYYDTEVGRYIRTDPVLYKNSYRVKTPLILLIFSQIIVIL